MVEINYVKNKFVCAHCGQQARMLPRTYEEVVTGKKETWIHVVDDTPACDSHNKGKLIKKRLQRDKAT